MRHTLPLLVSLLVPACGAEVITGSARSTPATDAPATGSPLPAGAPSGLGACTPRRADGAVLAFVSGADLVTVGADGSVRVLDAAPSSTPPAVVMSVAASPDGHVALSRQRRLPASSVENTYALLAPDGAVRWRLAQTTSYGGSPVRVSMGLHALFVSDGGDVVANHSAFNARRYEAMEFIAPDGASRWVDGAAAVGAADATGRVLLQARPDDGAAARWWSSRSGAVEPIDGESVAGVRLIGPYAVTVEVAGEGLALVSRRGARIDRVPLPSLRAGSFHVHGARDEGWVLLSSREGGPMVRVDLNTARSESITVRLPAGLRVVGGDLARPGLDADGALLAVLRDDERASLYRSVDGARWERVGRYVTGTLGVAVRARAGTYVVVAHNDLYVGEAWSEETSVDALRGPSLHVVRPESGREVVLYADDPSRYFGHDVEVALSASGRCAAWVETNDDETAVQVADLESGERRRLTLDAGMTAGRLFWF